MFGRGNDATNLWVRGRRVREEAVKARDRRAAETLTEVAERLAAAAILARLAEIRALVLKRRR
jgi:hypothetical protein